MVDKGINIKNQETCKLARKLSSLTGESLTQAIKVALEERMQRYKGKKRERTPEEIKAKALQIIEECSQLPVLDDRSPEEILGYDEDGLPT